MQQDMDALQKWFEMFQKQVPYLRKKDNGNLIGKFFIIRDSQIVEAPYDDFEKAYTYAKDKYKDDNFLVQELEPEYTFNFIFSA